LATANERLRLDIGLEADDIASLPEAEADDIFAEAGESYTDTASIKAATRVIALQRLIAQAATMTNYTQNNTREESGKISDNYVRLLGIWQGYLDAAVAAARGSAARFGRTTRRPARIKEHPGF
jgi:hypothetical protein